jgi:hypothetical protein
MALRAGHGKQTRSIENCHYEASFNIPTLHSEKSGMDRLSALAITTNKTVIPIHGTLTCGRPFALFDAQFVMGPHWTISAEKSLIAPNKARSEIESPAWNPSVALVLRVASAGDLSPCELKLG